VASNPGARRELERLEAEVRRLRDVERHLRRERDRVRKESLAELEKMQAALREAATHAGTFDDELERRAADATAREAALAAREAEVEAAAQRVRDADARLAEERQRLEAWRKRLERESERLAGWERDARLANIPAEQRQATFEEGLRRLADRGAGREASW
jgi:colicin import membrane protein